MSDDGLTLEIDYTNHRGDRAWRTVRGVRLVYGVSEYHGLGYRCMIEGHADDRDGAIRSFDLDSIHQWRHPSLPVGAAKIMGELLLREIPQADPDA